MGHRNLSIPTRRRGARWTFLRATVSFHSVVWTAFLSLFYTQSSWTLAEGPSPEKRAIGQFALTLWVFLAATAILFLGVGAMWFIRRLGRLQVLRQRRVPRRYFSSMANSAAQFEETDEEEGSEPDSSPE
jgi:hypothetical protein